jgi:hypothetical protein
MTDIFVSDISGYIINNESPFVIIKSSEIYKYLQSIYNTSNKNISIWEYKQDKVQYVLKDRNVNPSQFLILGNVLYKQNTYKPSMLILGNKSICKNPNSYEEIVSYEDGKIVKPKLSNDNEYEAIGLFYLKNGDKLDYNNIGLVPKKMIMQLDPISNDNITINDYCLLSYVPHGIKTINKNKIFGTNKNIKLLSTSNKYLTMTNTNEAKQQTKTSISKQTFSYNTQGELTNEGKCLTYDPKKSSIHFDLCNDNKTQKWNIFENTISPVYNFDKCLSTDSYDSDDLSLQSCVIKSDDQTWNTEGSDVTNSSDYILPTFGGKTVILVQNENPFYLNKEYTVEMNYKKDNLNLEDNIEDLENIDSTLAMNKEYAHYKSSQPLAISQKININNNIEKFDADNNNTSYDKQIILILLLSILCIVFYKYII